MSFDQQLQRITRDPGFIAALDQSGGSTPKALKQYGIDESAYKTEEEMFALVHQMRARIITSPAFNGERIIGAILFEKTMDDSIDGIPTARYLWERLRIVPFLKIDQGLAEEKDGAQTMKPIAGLDDLLRRAKAAGIFGTKMRSVIKTPSAAGIKTVIDQQFEIAAHITAHGLVPIIEPEIDIHAAQKEQCEMILKAEILRHLDRLPAGTKVMLKLTLPEQAGFYDELIAHKNVARVVALSGGYSLENACERLSRNDGMIASFSRALSNDLRAGQSDEEFNAALKTVIEKIYNASISPAAATKAA